jgi:hypothetical protein
MPANLQPEEVNATGNFFINKFRILSLPIEGKFWKYIHSTRIKKFQPNLQQTLHLKAGNNYEDTLQTGDADLRF